jgi:hypothetical protein
MAICLLFSPLHFFAQDDCQLRTQTPGGWGAPANGNNPGVYRDAHFDDAFPDGLTVGCDYTLTLTSAQSVEDYLPCGGPPAVLSQSYVDPDCIQNVFSQHIIALTLSVGFDLNDPDFGDADVSLADAIVNNGTFEGWTVAEILVMANEVFGGCSDAYSAGEAKSVVAMINENFVDGDSNNGNLDCDGCPDSTPPFLIYGPPNITVDCSDDFPLEDAVFGDDMDDDLDIFYEETTDGDGCNIEITRFWEATDNCENSFSYTQVITANDDSPPELVGVPSDTLAECGDVPDPAEVTADDNCDPNVEVDFDEDITQNECGYTIVRTWSAEDDCGNPVSDSQTIEVTDTTAPELVGVPEDVTLDCGEEAPDAIVSAIDNCDTDLTVVLTAVTIDLECGTQLTRTWSTTDDCGNPVEETQVVNFSDSEAPTLSDYPADMELECGELPPDAPVIEASDNCDPDVSVSFNEETIEGEGDGDCVLVTPEMDDPVWSLVMFGIPNGDLYYTTIEADLDLWMDGDLYAAEISGSVVSSSNANAGFDFVVTLYDGMDWETWESQPWNPTYKDDLGLAGDNYLDWLYFLIDGDNSYLDGWGDYEGTYFELTHAPGSMIYGYQYGVGANNVNTNFGNGGWVHYTGNFVDSANGINEFVDGPIADFAFDQFCCEDDTIVRTWTATDCSGNTETHTQTITYAGVDNPGAADLASQTCPEDSNGDGMVGAYDLLDLLTNYGCDSGDCSSDFNFDGKTDANDVLLFLMKFGDYCD